MLGSKRKYGYSSEHIVMIAINGDFSWDRSAISLGMFGGKPFRSWDHWDKSFFLDRQPAPRHAGAGGTGRRHRNTDHTAEGASTPTSQNRACRGPRAVPHGCRRIGNT